MRRSIAVTAVSVALLLTLSGCMWQTASGGGSQFPTLASGPVTGFPITGTYQARLTGAPETFGSCGTFSFAVTLTDSAGNTVTKDETGTGCPSISGSDITYSLTGTYNVTGGTGTYAGATGSGTSILTLTFHFFDPRQLPTIQWSSLEFGSFQVPGTASAANKRKRTFKSQGTVVGGQAVQGRWAQRPNL